MHISKGLIFRVYEGLLCSVIINWQLKTAKYLNKYFTKDEIKLGNKYLSPFFIRKIYIKKRYHYTFTRMAKDQKEKRKIKMIKEKCLTFILRTQNNTVTLEDLW